jgi:hypothetical protein
MNNSNLCTCGHKEIDHWEDELDHVFICSRRGCNCEGFLQKQKQSLQKLYKAEIHANKEFRKTLVKRKEGTKI